jgi:acyl-CoA thioester hydrolase
MANFSLPIQIRWADIDQNRHLRHSAYYDYGAMARMIFLSEHGITTQKLESLKIGPILFREEAVFKREITLDDKLMLDVELIKATKDFAQMLRLKVRGLILKKESLSLPMSIFNLYSASFHEPLHLSGSFVKRRKPNYYRVPTAQLQPGNACTLAHVLY